MRIFLIEQAIYLPAGTGQLYFYFVNGTTDRATQQYPF